MMNLKLNDKGMTLVEIVISIVILGIIGISFTECLVTSTRIVNRATLYKNESAKASEAVEIQDTKNTNIAQGTMKFKTSDGKQIEAIGEYISNQPEKTSTDTGLIYKEFVAGSSSTEFNGTLAEDVDENN